MEGALKTAVLQAAWAARDFLAFAAKAADEGRISVDEAIELLEQVKKMTTQLADAAQHDDNAASRPVMTLLRDCLVDLEALSHLGDLLQQYETTPLNAFRMAEACRYTARRVVGELACIEHMLFDL